MKGNLTDKQKLEIEEYAEKTIKKKSIGTPIIISSVISILFGTGLIMLGIIFIFIFWVIGLIMIIIGIIITNSTNKNNNKIKQLKQEEKEKMIKKLQLKALKGEK